MDDRTTRLRQEYRMFVRACHPDRGGDPDYFATELRRWQSALAAEGGGSPASAGQHGVTVYRRGPWPVRCGRAFATAWRRRRRTRVR